MITVSLCMIVKNEEDVLARCLESAKPVADEIIIVDTGSTDRTREIAREFTDNVCEFPWIDDFAAARNFSFSKATMEYCMVAGSPTTSCCPPTGTPFSRSRKPSPLRPTWS